MTRRIRLVVSCLLLAPMVLAAQAPPPGAQDQPTFRAEVTFIEVDVFVTDRSGDFVRDLTKDDFELLQDGEPQAVAEFSFVDLPLPGRTERLAAIETAVNPVSGRVQEGEGRVYSLLLDAPIITGAIRGTENETIRRIQNVATRFLDEAFGDDDLMSVLHVQDSPKPVQELTPSRPHLRAAIGALGAVSQRDPLDLLGRQTRVRTILNAYRAIEEEAERLGAIAGRRKAILWIGGRASFNPGVQGYDAAEMSAILFAHRDAVRAAARNNAAVYPIDYEGLTTRSGENEMLRVAGLRDVANDTGGVAIVNTNNLSGGFTRIVRDNSTYYLLGFYPEIEHRDGRFHEITVNVKRPGVSVRARRGFFAPERSAPASPVDLAQRSPAAAAIDALGASDFRDPLRLRATAATGAEGGAVWVVGELDARTRRERSWASGGKAEVSILASNGASVFSDVVEVAPTDLSFTVRAPAGDLPPGSYTVRLQMTGSGTASLSETTQVVVPAPGAEPIGEAVIWRRGPATGREHLRTADPRFRRNERLRLEVATEGGDPATARLLGSTGDPIQVPVQVSERQDGGVRWIVVDATLTPLAPSDYLIEITQGDESRVTAFRIIP